MVLSIFSSELDLTLTRAKKAAKQNKTETERKRAEVERGPAAGAQVSVAEENLRVDRRH